MQLNGEKGTKENHIGYYLLMDGLQDLYKLLEVKKGDIKSFATLLFEPFNIFPGSVCAVFVVFDYGYTYTHSPTPWQISLTDAQYFSRGVKAKFIPLIFYYVLPALSICTNYQPTPLFLQVTTIY